MSLQVIKCKTCNRVFAACKSEYIDDEWTAECDRYVKQGNSVVETVEPIKGENVFGDEPLNPCCGKPVVKPLTRTFTIEFGGHIKVRIVIENDEPKVTNCITGYGDALDIESIVITEEQ